MNDGSTKQDHQFGFWSSEFVRLVIERHNKKLLNVCPVKSETLLATTLVSSAVSLAPKFTVACCQFNRYRPLKVILIFHTIRAYQNLDTDIGTMF